MRNEPIDVDALQLQLLQAQLDCVLALVARGIPARVAIELVILTCREAENEVSAGEA